MTEHQSKTWAELKDELRISQSVEGREAYERARRLFELGMQVRELRRRRGLTQTQLARLAGTNQAAIARLESGGPEPRLSTLERIGRALDADLVVSFRVHETPVPIHSG